MVERYVPPDRTHKCDVAHPVDSGRIIAEQLAQSHQVLSECWQIQHNTDYSLERQLDTLKVAMRLMKINLKQHETLAGRPREFVHRIVVERVDSSSPHETPAAPIDVTPPSPLAPPPSKNLKTIHGGEPRVRTL